MTHLHANLCIFVVKWSNFGSLCTINHRYFNVNTLECSGIHVSNVMQLLQLCGESLWFSLRIFVKRTCSQGRCFCCQYNYKKWSVGTDLIVISILANHSGVWWIIDPCRRFTLSRETSHLFTTQFHIWKCSFSAFFLKLRLSSFSRLQLFQYYIQYPALHFSDYSGPYKESYTAWPLKSRFKSFKYLDQ